MTTPILILFMIFCHIVDDYYLQGWLASAKQKKWWEDNAPDMLHKNDYIWALVMHSFSWSFMIMLPILIYHFKEIIIGTPMTAWYLLFFIVNMMIHGIVDDLKANKKKFSLVDDQVCHMMQIFLTAMAFSVIIV